MGTEPPAAEEKLLTRVRGLLAKAESTSFPEEAAALTAKAQELMSRHAIDAARLATTGTARTGAEHRRVAVERPYASAKASLLGGVARANRCRAVSGSDGVTHLFGFDDDLRATELLFTSLLIQATDEMTRAGVRTDARGRSRTRSFRHAFLLAFAARVGERLREAADAVTEQADRDAGGAIVPVLAERDEAVEMLLRDTFPHVRSRRPSVSSRDGVTAGRRAADRADLGRPGVGPDPSSSRTGLGGR
ncbi:MAG: DUF2786 domain-containing protein [Actinomycetota bacterium]